MNRQKERGVALILTLILLLVLSVMAASLLFISRTETWSSMNYRLMSKARYGAEAGLDNAANYLMFTYAPPGNPGDPIASYNTLVSPVTAGGTTVTLSANNAVPSNYPVGAVQNAFNAVGNGSLTAGSSTVNYTAYATLLSMEQVPVYGSTTPGTVQTWQITGDGTIGGPRPATVEVSAILERQVTPVFAYAAFATNNGCGALAFSGGGSTDSYDSSAIAYKSGSVVTQAYGGNVGSNGNLNEAGTGTVINGTMSTPRTGVGSCSSGGVDAWTNKNAQVTGGLVNLPQPISYPPPSPPNPLPPTGNVKLQGSKGCPGGLSGCSGSKGNLTLAPGSYPDLSLDSGVTVTLTAGTYNINSLTLNGGATLIVDPGTPPAPIVVNIAGQGVPPSQAVLDFTGGSVSNATLDPSMFQIDYAGSGTIQLNGGAQAAAVVYAPNAPVSLNGNGSWFGAVIGQTVKDSGGAPIHYDRKLQTEMFTLGNYMLDSFTWKKF